MRTKTGEVAGNVKTKAMRLVSHALRNLTQDEMTAAGFGRIDVDHIDNLYVMLTVYGIGNPTPARLQLKLSAPA